MTHEIIAAVCGGGAVVAIIEGIREALAHRRSRRAIPEDREHEDLEGRVDGLESDIDRLTKMVSALVDSNKFLIYERIRYLGQVYISKEEIDFDERRILHSMHDTYHNKLNGKWYFSSNLSSHFKIYIAVFRYIMSQVFIYLVWA